MSWEERLAEFRARLRAVVRKRLMADVPLGSFLRGGLDSSLITALIREDRTKMHTFSVATEDGADRDYAQHVAGLLGTTHHEYLLKPVEIWEALPADFITCFKQSL
ncbi:asparagine synthase [Hydrogenispora ethanolica]|uniref:Asparagine synthase n=1 Tax=Hydrogenispora ethanolica TaxID=1082276 RepID=A0A4R1SBA3_HYDET|nr:asparagine synthase-related protein [Hydrogenispora ethanolica]TCL76823.1 asparagine synthase [Hydrogenispora ethanolica]